MTRTMKATLLAGAAMMAGAVQAQETGPAATPTPAPAEATATPAPARPAASAIAAQEGEGAIVVTARRQNETLRDVPATVSVLTSDTIARTGARVATDFVQLTAGVTIETGATEPADTSINIRGLNGARDAEGNVGLVIDGILKTSAAGLNEPQGAITQVEILKGPQGAIYGRNASAGAIVITTKKPGDKLEGSFKGQIANDHTYLLSGLVSGPITDTMGFVANVEWTRSDGFYRNTFLGTALAKAVYPGYSTNRNSIDNYNNLHAFGRLVITPSDDTEIDAKVNYGRNRGSAVTYNAVFQIPALAAAFNDPIFNDKVSNHKFLFTNNTESQSWQDTYGGSIRLTQHLGGTILYGSAAYNNEHNDYIAGGTSAAFGFFNNEPNCIRTRAATDGQVTNPEPFNTYAAAFGGTQPYAPNTCDGIQTNKRRQKDVSAEVRLASEPGSPLQWQLGGSYLYIDRRACVTLTLDTGHGSTRKCFTTNPLYPTEEVTDDNYRTNVYAAFANVDYAASSKLKAGVALRYDIEARETSNNVPLLARTRWVGNPLTGFPDGTETTPANYYLNSGLDPAYNPSGVLAPRSKTFKQLEPKLTVSYKPNRDTTLYASWGIGFKAGGFNGGGTEAIVDGYFNAPPSAGGVGAGIFVPGTYKKETDRAAEAGIKGRLFNALDYELIGYYTDVRNMQYFEFFVGDFGVLRSVSNIDKVRIYGGEASLNYRITPRWSIFASGNVTNSRIQKNRSRPYTVGNKSPTTPDYTINAGTQILEPITDTLRMLGRVDVRVTGPTPFGTVQDNTVPTAFGLDANYKNSTRSTYTLVNARLGIETDRWSLAMFANNLFDKHYLNDVVIAPEFGGDFVAPGQLRRWGLEGTFKF